MFTKRKRLLKPLGLESAPKILPRFSKQSPRQLRSLEQEADRTARRTEMNRLCTIFTIGELISVNGDAVKPTARRQSYSCRLVVVCRIDERNVGKVEQTPSSIGSAKSFCLESR